MVATNIIHFLDCPAINTLLANNIASNKDAGDNNLRLLWRLGYDGLVVECCQLLENWCLSLSLHVLIYILWFFLFFSFRVQQPMMVTVCRFCLMGITTQPKLKAIGENTIRRTRKHHVLHRNPKYFFFVIDFFYSNN